MTKIKDYDCKTFKIFSWLISWGHVCISGWDILYCFFILYDYTKVLHSDNSVGLYCSCSLSRGSWSWYKTYTLNFHFFFFLDQPFQLFVEDRKNMLSIFRWFLLGKYTTLPPALCSKCIPPSVCSPNFFKG
jgi:hypothetical protein